MIIFHIYLLLTSISSMQFSDCITQSNWIHSSCHAEDNYIGLTAIHLCKVEKQYNLRGNSLHLCIRSIQSRNHPLHTLLIQPPEKINYNIWSQGHCSHDILFDFPSLTSPNSLTLPKGKKNSNMSTKYHFIKVLAPTSVQQAESVIKHQSFRH